VEALREWTAIAAQDPSNPRSFTPLFLAEMARLQDPPVDLLGSYDERPGRGDGPPVDLRSPYRSALLRFSLLELQLFAAAFLDPTPRAAALGEQPPLFPRPDVLRARFVPDPCVDLKKELEQIGKAVGEELSGPVAGEIGSAAAGTLGGEALSATFGKLLSNELGADRAEALGRATAALGLAAKILKLASFYGQAQISVTPEPLRLHKPTGADEMAMFVATAGVDENDLKEFERLRNSGNSSLDRQTSDCLESMGIPQLSDLSGIAQEAENWLVEWDIVEGMPPHATYYMNENDYYLKGRRAMKMKRHDASSARADFIIHILPEREHSGKIVRAYVTARAKLDAAAPPSIGTFVNAVKGLTGLIDSLVELGAGWLQYMNQPKAYGSIEVEYHCPKPRPGIPAQSRLGMAAAAMARMTA
jgi:hypothetical protein